MSWGIAVLTVVSLTAIVGMVLSWPGRRADREQRHP